MSTTQTATRAGTAALADVWQMADGLLGITIQGPNAIARKENSFVFQDQSVV